MSPWYLRLCLLSICDYVSLVSVIMPLWHLWLCLRGILWLCFLGICDYDTLVSEYVTLVPVTMSPWYLWLCHLATTFVNVMGGGIKKRWNILIIYLLCLIIHMHMITSTTRLIYCSWQFLMFRSMCHVRVYCGHHDTCWHLTRDKWREFVDKVNVST